MKMMADDMIGYDLQVASRSSACLSAPSSRVLDLQLSEEVSAAHASVAGPRATTRRGFEIALVSATLIFILPLLVTIFVMLKLQDGGPALFGHWRIGRGGRRFRCWKFRTMVVDAEQRLQHHLASSAQARLEWSADQKLRVDPRVTPLGRFLRKSSLDELPQLLNVLSGEMSLVGPRPIVADEIRKYGRRYRDYTCVRPGLTGLWQVSGRNQTTYRRRVALDTVFVNRWSLGLDLAILLRTIKVVVTSHGAF